MKSSSDGFPGRNSSGAAALVNRGRGSSDAAIAAGALFRATHAYGAGGGRSRDLPALLTLYEASYSRLRRLAPELREMSGTVVSRVAGATPLYATILESHKYTTQLLLTYRFERDAKSGQPRRTVPDMPHDPAHAHGPVFEPFVRLSIYHDVQSVELLSHCRRRPLRRVLPLDTGSPLGLRQTLPEVERRWEANRFVLKWLKFLAFQGHMFLGSTAQPSPEMDELVRERIARDRANANAEEMAEA